MRVSVATREALEDKIDKFIDSLVDERRVGYPASILEDEFLYELVLNMIDEIFAQDQFDMIETSVCDRNDLGYVIYINLLARAAEAEQLFREGAETVDLLGFEIDLSQWSCITEDEEDDQDQFGLGV